MTKLPAKAGDPVKALIHAIAMDIGKEAVDYIQRSYPAVAKVVPPSTFWLGLRNCIHNEIMAAIEVNDEGQIIARLNHRQHYRQKMKRVRRMMDELKIGDRAGANQILVILREA